MREPLFPPISPAPARRVTRHPEPVDLLGQIGMREATWDADPARDNFQRRLQQIFSICFVHGEIQSNWPPRCTKVLRQHSDKAVARSASAPIRADIPPADQWFALLCLLAPRAGLEPATLRLTAARSTIELPRIGVLNSDTRSDGGRSRQSLLKGYAPASDSSSTPIRLLAFRNKTAKTPRTTASTPSFLIIRIVRGWPTDRSHSENSRVPLRCPRNRSGHHPMPGFDELPFQIPRLDLPASYAGSPA